MPGRHDARGIYHKKPNYSPAPPIAQSWAGVNDINSEKLHNPHLRVIPPAVLAADGISKAAQILRAIQSGQQ
jgi:hypothetical protein